MADDDGNEKRREREEKVSAKSERQRYRDGGKGYVEKKEIRETAQKREEKREEDSNPCLRV